MIDLFKFRTINWLGYSLDNPDVIADYKNLDNNSYWQRKMTPSEWEAKKHPNRSAAWVPQRLERKRDELRCGLLDVIVGPENHANESLWYKGDCKNCGVSYDEESEFRTNFKDCLKSKGENMGMNEWFSDLSSPEYEIIRQECWDEVTAQYDNQVIRSSEITDWSQRSMPWGGANRPYGMCSYCYAQAKVRMREIIALI
ncbi:MAG: hypothetical protein ACTSPB_01710 [Candidatus Thorarchaeota archaeon]